MAASKIKSPSWMVDYVIKKRENSEPKGSTIVVDVNCGFDWYQEIEEMAYEKRGQQLEKLDESTGFNNIHIHIPLWDETAVFHHQRSASKPFQWKEIVDLIMHDWYFGIAEITWKSQPETFKASNQEEAAESFMEFFVHDVILTRAGHVYFTFSH
jgi:hypothetical protein